MINQGSTCRPKSSGFLSTPMVLHVNCPPRHDGLTWSVKRIVANRMFAGTCRPIHSGHFYSAPFKSSTPQRRSRLQYGCCIGVSRRSAQATVGKELAQGPYVTARAGVEPTTLWLKVIDSTKAPSRPIRECLRAMSVMGKWCKVMTA